MAFPTTERPSLRRSIRDQMTSSTGRLLRSGHQETSRTPCPVNNITILSECHTFWNVWTRIYLKSLVARKKWCTKERNFVVGDAVLVVEPNLPRYEWRTGHVCEVFPGDDGLVWVVRVRTPVGTYLRPIHRLCLLEPMEESGSPDPKPDSAENVATKPVWITA